LDALLIKAVDHLFGRNLCIIVTRWRFDSKGFQDSRSGEEWILVTPHVDLFVRTVCRKAAKMSKNISIKVSIRPATKQGADRTVLSVYLTVMKEEIDYGNDMSVAVSIG
jgi:hypothetical protein